MADSGVARRKWCLPLAPHAGCPRGDPAPGHFISHLRCEDCCSLLLLFLRDVYRDIGDRVPGVVNSDEQPPLPEKESAEENAEAGLPPTAATHKQSVVRLYAKSNPTVPARNQSAAALV